MKSNHTILRRKTVPLAVSAAALVAMAVSQQVHSANQTWDGGAGTGTAWFTNTNWVSDTGFAGSQTLTTSTDIATFTATGTGSPIGINMNFAGNTFYLGAIDMTGNTARLIGNSSTTAGTTVLNGATVNSVANTILRNTSTALMTIQATQSGAMGLTLGNATDNIVQITNTGGITISSIISGVGRNLTRQGSGTGVLILSGANTYTGATTVSAGAINIQNASALGTTAGGTIVASGGALQIQNNITVGAEALSLTGSGTATTVSLNGTGVSATAALRNISGNNTYGGVITLGGATRINSDAGTLTLSGGVAGTNFNLTFGGAGNTSVSTNGITTGSGTLTKDNLGTLTLSAANAYTGATTVLGGTLALAREVALYNGAAGSWTAANINVKGGGTLALNVGGAGEFGTASLATLLGNISVANTAAEGLQANAILGIDTTNAGGSFTPAAAITNSTGAFGGTIGLSKLGAGTLVLDLANTYTGVTAVNAGTLQLGSGGTGGTLGTASPITVATGATFAVNQTDTVTQGTDFSGAAITGTGNFAQLGTGTTVLNVANTFTGTTTVSAGTLQLDSALALQNSALVTTGGGTVLLGTGVISPTIGGLSGTTGDLAAVFSTSYGSIANLTLNLLSGSALTYGGVISANTPNMTLTKSGPGTQILIGPNTYAGTTTISGGTLTVGNGLTGSLNGTTGTALTFTATGVFNVAEAASSTQGMGALTLSAGDATVTSTAAGAASAATLTFASLAERTAGSTGNFTLAVNTTSTGATPNVIAFTGTSKVPLAGGSSDPGLFFGGGNYARYDAAGYLRAVIYGTDTNTNAALSGAAVTDLGTIGSGIDTRFNGAARATTNSGAAASGTNTNTLVVANASLFSVGQILTGTGIAANTYITAIDTGTNTLTLVNPTGNAIGGTAVAANATLTPYNSVTAQVTGSVNTLNLSGLGASLTLGATQTLSVNGILRTGGTAAATSVISGGTGLQTVSSGGELVVRADLATDTMVIASPILDNGGSSLTKSGAGALLLAGANTYTGTTTLNGGAVTINNPNSFGPGGTIVAAGNSQIAALGNNTYANPITINSGVTLNILNPATGTASTATFSGVLAGSGTLFLPNSGANAIQGILAFTNAANTFTGNVVLAASGSGDEHFQFNSIGDGGNFTFAKNGNRQLMTYTGSSSVTFNSRQIVIASTMINGGTTDRQGMDGGGSNPVSMFANDGTGTISFTRDMVVNNITSNYGVLYFGGTNTGDNTFAGKISDTSGASKLAIGKFGGGKWILTGSNTYEGNTLIVNGTLSVGTIANSSIAQPLGIGPAIQFGVGGNSTSGTLEFTGTTASTDKQVQIGSPLQANGLSGGNILNNGSGVLTFTNPIFNPASTGITATRTLTLGGNYGGGVNEIQGVIQDNVASTGRVALAVSGSTWKLSGVNSFTGGTTINAGTLQVSGGSALVDAGLVTMGTTPGATLDVLTSETIASLIGGGAAGGSVTIGASQTLTLSAGGGNTYAGTVGGAGALTLSGGTQTLSGSLSHGGGINVTTAGAVLTLSGSGNTYTGVTNINGGGRGLIVSADGALGATGAGNQTTVVGAGAGNGGEVGFSGGIIYTALERIVGSGAGATTGTIPGFITNQRGFIQSVSGNNTFNGSVELDANGVSRIGTQDGASLTLAGPITQASGITTASILFRTGNFNGDFVTLSNTGNSFGGNSAVFTSLATAGQYSGLRIGADNAHPTNLTVQNFSTASGSSTALDLNSYDQTLNGLASGGAGTLNIINLRTAIGEESTLTLNPTADQNSGTSIVILGGSPGGNPLGVINVVKDGAFTQTLAGVNTYTGTTTVTNGTLLVSGSISGSAVTVNGGMLGGAGGTTGAVTVNTGGTLAPGASPGVLNTGDTTFNGGTFSLELNSATAGTGYDQLNVTGTVSLASNSPLTLSLGYDPVDGVDSFTVINNDGTDTVTTTGLFTFGGGPLNEGALFTASGQIFQITYAGGVNSNDVVLIAVPEPGSASALLAGMGLLLGIRRRSRK